MATKEATVYAIDLGSTMADCHSGRTESDLEYGLRYVYDKIAEAMSSTRTTLNIGVIGLRTNDTDNPLGGEGYENISVLQPLGPMTLAQFRALKAKIIPSQTEAGDVVSAIVVGIQMIEQFTMGKTGKPLKYLRKIVVLTDGQGRIDDENLDDIVTRINEMGIELVVMGVDFDDADFGFKEQDKSIVKKENEDLLRDFVEKCNNSVFGTAAEAIESLSIPKIKSTKPYTTYEGRLCFGDVEKYPETAMYIDVKRLFKTKVAKPVSASSFVTQTGVANGQASAQSSHTLPGDVEMTDAPTGDLSAVKSARIYKVNDPSHPLGKRDVDREELAKGYEYGRTAVHISESDENVTKLETIKSFSIIGFIPNDKYEKYFTMGESCITIAQPVNDKARLAFSSLVHALFELDSYAVARIVLKDGKDPQILLLAPSIDTDLEALVDVPLPFAEDVRMYRFPPLDRVITASGTTVEKHRYLPSNDLDNAMSQYVDSMDISTFGKDDEGQPTEYMPIDETFSPIVHRINQAIRHRAIYPGPIGPPAQVLMKWSEPPAELVAQSTSQLKRLMAIADVKKVPPKAKGKRNRREIITPLSGLDVDSLLRKQEPKKVSKNNAIPDFKQMLNEADTDDAIVDVVNQMSDVIQELIKDSMGDLFFEQAEENIRVMREQIVEYEMPDLYNNFMRNLTKRILKGELGENRREFLIRLKAAKLGLIDDSTLEMSNVSPKDAAEFYSMSTDLPTRSRED